MNALSTPVVQTPAAVDLETHHATRDGSDRAAHGISRGLRYLADTFFAKRDVVDVAMNGLVGTHRQHRLAQSCIGRKSPVIAGGVQQRHT